MKGGVRAEGGGMYHPKKEYSFTDEGYVFTFADVDDSVYFEVRKDDNYGVALMEEDDKIVKDYLLDMVKYEAYKGILIPMSFEEKIKRASDSKIPYEFRRKDGSEGLDLGPSNLSIRFEKVVSGYIVLPYAEYQKRGKKEASLEEIYGKAKTIRCWRALQSGRDICEDEEIEKLREELAKKTDQELV